MKQNYVGNGFILRNADGDMNSLLLSLLGGCFSCYEKLNFWVDSKLTYSVKDYYTYLHWIIGELMFISAFRR